jgi:hypothetical protein
MGWEDLSRYPTLAAAAALLLSVVLGAGPLRIETEAA